MEAKEINLWTLLENVPTGTKLYSPLLGECELEGVTVEGICIRYKGSVRVFSYDGRYFAGCGECMLFPSKDNRDWDSFKVDEDGKEDPFKTGDHIRSKENGAVYFLVRKSQEPDGFWAKQIISDCEIFISNQLFDEYETIDKFHPSLLKPFDKVLVRHASWGRWSAELFSHLIEDDDANEYTYTLGGTCCTTYCIPFNGETKHLIGTNDDAPDFYKI